MKLSDYIRNRCPNGIYYQDAAQTCIWLHITLDFCPHEFHDEVLPKESLASAFAELSRYGIIKGHWQSLSFRYGAHFHNITDKGHWLEVIASMYKKGPAVVDLEAQECVARIMGCGADKILKPKAPGNHTG